MKITQITGNTYVNDDGEVWSMIFGLGEDNNLYKWSYTDGEWKKYNAK